MFFLLLEILFNLSCETLLFLSLMTTATMATMMSFKPVPHEQVFLDKFSLDNFSNNNNNNNLHFDTMIIKAWQCLWGRVL